MADREAQFQRCLGLFSGDDGPGPARVGPLRAMAINGVVVAASSPPPPRTATQQPQQPPLPLPPASAREFLLSRPPGAYTAISVSSSGCAQFWQEHCERLASTLAILSEEEVEESEGGAAAREERQRQEPPLFPLFRAWHAASEGGVPLPLASLVGDALLPGVRAAVAAVRGLQRAEMEAFVTAEAVPAAAAAAGGGGAAGGDDDEEVKDTAPVSSSRCAGSGPVNVVALLTDPAGDPGQRQQDFQHPESLPLDVAVFAWEPPRAPFRGSAAAVAAAAFTDASDVPSSPSSPSSSFSESRPSSSSASEGPAFVPVLSAAVVVGGPRERPHAKDSRWVRDRQPLERKLAEAAVAVAEGEEEEEEAGGVAAAAGGGGARGLGGSLPASWRKEREGLLADEQGRLLEGLVTNVFVVVADDDDDDEDYEARAWVREEEEGGAGFHRRRGCAVDLSRFSLHTAAAGDGGGGSGSGSGSASILDGVMRRAVLEAAESLELRVVASPPDPRDRRRWREAFVTSALRGVAAVARVQGGGEEEGNIEPWSVDFSSRGGGGGGGGLPGFVTREIADALPGVTWRHEVKL